MGKKSRGQRSHNGGEHVLLERLNHSGMNELFWNLNQLVIQRHLWKGWKDTKRFNADDVSIERLQFNDLTGCDVHVNNTNILHLFSSFCRLPFCKALAVVMVLLTVLKKLKQKEKEMRLLML